MIKNIIRKICFFFSLSVIAGLISVFLLVMYFNAPNSYQKEDKKFIVTHGMTFRGVTEKLHSEGIVEHPTAFLYISQIVKGYDPTVRYGEYFFEKHSSYYKILHKMVRGFISFRKVTVIEGSSVKTALDNINSSYGLIGELPQNIMEGSLLPETYFYSYNDTKASMVKRMQDSMVKTVDELWETRSPNLPIKNKLEAIILASIVEKETGVASERGKVASVFVNRLRKGMKLQSDPTIIYSYAFGDKSKERPIRRSDINNNSKYNTYHIYGLPPTPICNPGIDSIKAVLNPPETDYLYFVASGIGREHNFSSTINDHNNFVAGYRKAIKESKETPTTAVVPSN